MLRGTAGRGQVTVTTYDKKMENFDTMNISNLDTWVFDKVWQFLSFLVTYLEYCAVLVAVLQLVSKLLHFIVSCFLKPRSNKI